MPSRNRVVIPARQAKQPGGIGSLESILGLLIKRLKIRARIRVGAPPIYLGLDGPPALGPEPPVECVIVGRATFRLPAPAAY